jgi:hypothetical protein
MKIKIMKSLSEIIFQLWSEYLSECLDHGTIAMMDDFALYCLIRMKGE